MPNKILVAYASRTGSAAGVAEAIGQSLAESGAPVEVRLMQDVKDLAPYRAVVAGSAIHGRQWLPEAMQFMQTHRAALLQKPFAAFLVCMTLAIAKRWLAECVTFKDHTFPQLLLIEFAHDAADRIYQAIVAATPGTPALKPILRPYDTLGSTRYVDFDTTRPVYATRDDKCHISQGRL